MPNVPNVAVPLSSSRTSRTESRASWAAASVRSASGRNSRPASVSSSRRARTNSGAPSSASSRRICSDRLGWAMCNAAAAAEKRAMVGRGEEVFELLECHRFFLLTL